MKRMAAALIALLLAGCATGGGPTPQTAEESKPRQMSVIEEMGQAGGGGY